MVELLHLAESADVGATLTVDRAVATLAAVVALAGVVTGWRAHSRAAAGRSRNSLIALAAGAAGLIAGVWVLATADGGPGTGNGVVGGYAGVLFGLVAVALGGTARARSRAR
ncbi:hypothetical protein Aph02nite_32790 [Actinoplanes philippinensis]|uniref:Uncharacterized protein n=1 Tax=Actinoplanes philippinensis TaxID=35752 RepID=A0A1I2E1Y7_9ACTN|nr:DUF6223 family protein [Actinoplanes philippinensis]GIE77329.1 hypothetical protein Aph02nite_32790 [Actinoplanes philippinensis]SFE86633.1 hypothetical protein SAMN05421541_104124 [Actinoplanes philippinensis]